MFILLALCFLVAVQAEYTPIIFLHGLGGSAADFRYLNEWIQHYHPGTKVFPLSNFDGVLSGVVPVWEQAKKVYQSVTEIIKKNNLTSFHFFSHSQGGLIIRTLLQEHRIPELLDVFSFVPPQMGTYGIPEQQLPAWLQHYGLTELSLILYTKAAQDIYTPAGYWRDPYRDEMYEDRNLVLPILNNQTKNDKADLYRTNFLSNVRTYYLFGSSGDKILNPWQTAHFGFFELGQDKTTVPLEKSKMWETDAIGIRTLKQSGRLIMQEGVPPVDHNEWLEKEWLFTKYVLPYLK